MAGTRALELAVVRPASSTHSRRILLVGARHVPAYRCIVPSTEYQPQGSTTTSGSSSHRRCKPAFGDARDNRASTQRRRRAASQHACYDTYVHHCGGHPINPLLVAGLQSLERNCSMHTSAHGTLLRIALLLLMQRFQSPRVPQSPRDECFTVAVRVCGPQKNTTSQGSEASSWRAGHTSHGPEVGFRPVVSPLLLPRLVLSRSCSTLRLPWAVCPLGTSVQWSEDVIKADPFVGRSRVRFRVPPWVSNTIARDHLA